MSKAKISILPIAIKETLAEVKLGSPTSILLTVGTPISTLLVTYFFSHSIAISAAVGFVVLTFAGVCVFVTKLFSIPMRLLNEAKAKLTEHGASQNIEAYAKHSQPLAHDITLFNRFITLISTNDIAFFEGFYFGDYIPRDRLRSIQEFYRTWDMPQHTFLSEVMNSKFDEVKYAAEVFMTTIAKNTTMSHIRKDSLTVRTDADPMGQSEHTQAEIAELNAAATKFVDVTKEFHLLAMRNGFQFHKEN